MKSNLKLISGLAVAAMVCSLAISARAGIYTWSAPVPITTADATLTQSGTVVGAAVFGSDNKLVVLSSGDSIYFTADGSVATTTGDGTTYGSLGTNTTGNANFNGVLNQFNYDGGPKAITLNNLNVGQQYAVQLFSLDNRGSNPNSRHANFQDPSDAANISATFGMGDDVYVIGTFTATSSTTAIQENLVNGGGSLNGLVVRALGVNIAPAITVQPQPTSVYHGLPGALVAGASGTGPLSYQWQKGNVGGSIFTNVSNGGNISGATSNVLSFTSLVASNTADYQVIVTSAYGSVTSSPATLMVLAGTPQFVWSAPAPITSADATLGLTGTVVGAAVFGSTPTVVTLTNGTTIDFKTDGSAATLVAGGFGTANGAFTGNTSNANFNAVLNQFTYDGGPDVIQLNNLFIGQQYAVQLFALDDRGGKSSAITANYQDANDAYNISTTFAMGDNVYTIGTFTAGNTTVTIQENLLNNNGGNINAVVIRALGGVIAPQITTQPQSATIDQGVGTPVKFISAASGTTPLTYRWQRGPVGSGIFTNVLANARYAGLTGPILTISNAVAGDAADYQIVVANAAGSATSAPPATLTVNAVTPLFAFSIPATITTADAALTQSGTIVGAEVFGSAPKIVLLSNGTAVDFKTNGAVATSTGGGIASGAFSGNTGNATFNAVLNQFSYEDFFASSSKTITLNNLVVGQQYAAQLFALDNRNGTGSRTANFQDPADAADYSSTFAMPDNVYTIATFTAGSSSVNLQENLYGGGGNINAIVLRRLTGLPLAPQITTQPSSVTNLSGLTAQFTVGANGTSLTYQWQRAVVGSGVFGNVNDGNASGNTTAQLTIANLTGANAADYRVIVSNGSGSVTSSVATLAVIGGATVLTHRWSFNEASGTVAHDSIGGADGTMQGGAFLRDGYAVLPNTTGTAADSSYVSIPGGLLNGLSAVTVECWVTNNGWGNGNTFVGFGGPTDPSGSGTNFISFFARWFNAISAFQIQTVAGDSGIVGLGDRVNYNAIISPPSPAHYVYLYNPTVGTVALYTNGVLSGAVATGVTIPLSTLGTAQGTIGRAIWNTNFGGAAPIPGTSGNRPFMNAGVSEVRIYSGILSSNAIALDYQFGPDKLPPATLTHRWSFNEASGTVAHDSIGGADGTMQGGAFLRDGYAVLPNTTGTAADSSYVSIPGGLLNGLSAVTVECWVTNNGWGNGNTFVGFGGPTDPSGSGTNFISFFARWFNAISAFQIQTVAGDSGIVGLGDRVNYNAIISPPSPAHYVYLYNPTVGTVALYTNGVLSGAVATGVTIPLSTLGTAQGTIGRAIWNTNFGGAAPIPGTSGNRPFMNAGVSEVRIYSSILSSNAIALDYQLGPDLLPAVTSTNKPTVSVSSAPGTLTLSWPTASGSFFVESSPVLAPNPVWTPVRGSQSVVGSNYQITIPTTNGPALFFRLHQ